MPCHQVSIDKDGIDKDYSKSLYRTPRFAWTIMPYNQVKSETCSLLMQMPVTGWELLNIGTRCILMSSGESLVKTYSSPCAHPLRRGIGTYLQVPISNTLPSSIHLSESPKHQGHPCMFCVQWLVSSIFDKRLALEVLFDVLVGSKPSTCSAVGATHRNIQLKSIWSSSILQASTTRYDTCFRVDWVRGLVSMLPMNGSTRASSSLRKPSFRPSDLGCQTTNGIFVFRTRHLLLSLDLEIY
jgi:hypothetical protein